ncbi:MAG TPA: phosphatidylglycerophosphatase A [Gammaproteobacteria bacterium]|jgi:phosphatidylglycerophosphatase A|nr:phosphatidylglycerophosphatase A [Gammaproteobacteria bacterium]
MKRFHLMSMKKKSLPIPAAIWQDPYYFLAFGLGTGAIPFAPGTFGTLMAIPFYLLLATILPAVYYVVFVGVFVMLSVWLCERVSQAMHVHDHPGMVIDEFAGFFVTMMYAPAGWIWVVMGFILFRIFDIWKPWPIHWLDEKIAGGLGIVLDDVIAGIYALIIMHGIGYLL